MRRGSEKIDITCDIAQIEGFGRVRQGRRLCSSQEPRRLRLFLFCF